MVDERDQPFLDALEAVADDDWRALWRALDDVAGRTEHATWAGGETRTEADGRTVTSWPYPVYHPSVEALRSAIGGARLMVVYDWPVWPDLPRYRDEPALLADAPVADAVRMVVAVIRSERFSDGSLEGALTSGLLQTALARIRRWAAEHGRPDADR
ncbi:MAG: DUF6508 domain-containing protein [Actinomycetota bacterium]